MTKIVLKTICHRDWNRMIIKMAVYNHSNKNENYIYESSATWLIINIITIFFSLIFLYTNFVQQIIVFFNKLR